MSNPIRVTVWNEFIHERTDDRVKAIYPDGMHKLIADYLNAQEGMTARIASLDQPEQGLSDEVVNNTDVLIWWGHKAHDQVRDDLVAKVHTRVLQGMGLIPLHSAHYSKIFKRVLGTECSLKWREAGEKERLWNLEPSHPITQGIGEFFELPCAEMYGEPFDIPTPDKLLLISWFQGGEVFRSGCCWERSNGRIFYFRPGHETYPIYHNDTVKLVIANAVRWAAPRRWGTHPCPKSPPLEDLPGYAG